MTNATPGRIYALMVNRQVRQVFDSTVLPVWDETQIVVRDITDINPLPTVGEWTDGTEFSNFTPTPPLQSDIDAQARDGLNRTSISEARTQPALVQLLNATPAEINAYIDANVTNLVEARNVLKLLARAVSIVARDVIDRK